MASETRHLTRESLRSSGTFRAPPGLELPHFNADLTQPKPCSEEALAQEGAVLRNPAAPSAAFEVNPLLVEAIAEYLAIKTAMGKEVDFKKEVPQAEDIDQEKVTAIVVAVPPVPPFWAEDSDQEKAPTESSTAASESEIGWLTIGSVGHPTSCGQPCKYNYKARGCKDEYMCTRCHLCKWTCTRKSKRLHASAIKEKTT